MAGFQLVFNDPTPKPFTPIITLDNLKHRLDIIIVAPNAESASKLIQSPTPLMNAYINAGLSLTLAVWMEDGSPVSGLPHPPPGLNVETRSMEYCEPTNDDRAQINSLCTALEVCKDDYFVFSAILDAELEALIGSKSWDDHLLSLRTMHTVPHNRNNYITNLQLDFDDSIYDSHPLTVTNKKFGHSLPRKVKRSMWGLLCDTSRNSDLCDLPFDEAVVTAMNQKKGLNYKTERSWPLLWPSNEEGD